jgi:hypothetical protein
VFHSLAVWTSHKDRLRSGELNIHGRLTRSGSRERNKAAATTIHADVHCAHPASNRWYGFFESGDVDDLL